MTVCEIINCSGCRCLEREKRRRRRRRERKWDLFSLSTVAVKSPFLFPFFSRQKRRELCRCCVCLVVVLYYRLSLHTHDEHYTQREKEKAAKRAIFPTVIPINTFQLPLVFLQQLQVHHSSDPPSAHKTLFFFFWNATRESSKIELQTLCPTAKALSLSFLLSSSCCFLFHHIRRSIIFLASSSLRLSCLCPALSALREEEEGRKVDGRRRRST